MPKDLPVTEVEFREDLYPRDLADSQLIDHYAEILERLPPIRVNQDNILIDGYHRWKAHDQKKVETIKVEVIETVDEKELRKLSFEFNSKHGKQLRREEKQKYAEEMVGEMKVEELCEVLSVSKSTINAWTKSIREERRQKRDQKMLDLKKEGWTQQEIAEELDVPQQTVSDRLTKMPTSDRIGRDFRPDLLDVWNQKDKDIGSIPVRFMQNLLFFHTKESDLVFDPFAGTGTTAEACELMNREHYSSDINVRPGKEEIIKEWDITKGLPDDLPKPDLAFLDPLYIKQAKAEHTDKPEDFSNMNLKDFYTAMQNLFDQLKKRDVRRIAVVIVPTINMHNKNLVHHMPAFHNMLKDTYRMESRYILTYPSEVHDQEDIKLTADNKTPLWTTRELVVWIEQ